MTLLLNTTEVVMALLTKHQPCTCKALWQQQVGRDRLALTTIKNLLMRLKTHGAVTACGQEGNAYLYQLTGTSPYAPCITCRGKTLQWHLHNGYCKDCRPKESLRLQQAVTMFDQGYAVRKAHPHGHQE